MRKTGIVTVALLLASSGAVAAGTFSKKVTELNKLSGTEAVNGALKELLDDKESARKLLAEAATLVKDKKANLSYQAAYVLALAAGDFKDFDSSEIFFRVCMDQAGKLQSTTKLLESYGGLIDLYYDNKKFDKSAIICQELLELKFGDGKAREVFRLEDKDFFEDGKKIKKEVFIPDDWWDPAERLRPGVHRLLIQSLAKQGKFDRALKMVDKLIKENDHWLEHQLKGWLHREAGQFAEAAKVYEQVIEDVQKERRLDPEARDAYEDRYRYILSNVYVDLRQIDKATEQLQTLIKRKPDEPGYHNDLGYIWADHDMNLEEAEKLVRKALELDRKNRKGKPEAEEKDKGAYLDSLGWVLYKQKKHKEALTELLKAVEDKDSQHIEIYDHLGDVYMALGDRDKALDAWRTGLKHVGEGRREAARKEEVERKIEKHSK